MAGYSRVDTPRKPKPSSYVRNYPGGVNLILAVLISQNLVVHAGRKIE